MTKLRGTSRGWDVRGKRSNGEMLKGKTKPVAGLAFVFLLTAACAQSRFESQLRPQAPRNASETGVVVRLGLKNSSAQLQTLLEDPKVQYRVLNKEQGLYEVFNISKDEIQEQIGDVGATRNVYIDHLIPHTDEQKPVSLLRECRKDVLPPVAVLVPQKLKDKLLNKVLDITDGEVAFSAEKSKNINPLAKKLDAVWTVSGPAGSAFAKTTLKSPSLNFIPDIPGRYTVTLTVQNDLDVCDSDTFEFGVTANVAYEGPAAPRKYNETKDPIVFHHLTEIGAQTAWPTSKGEGIVIAVLDTGVNYNHADLRANILQNSREIPNNDIDDDKNGYVDDVVGWDFYFNDRMPYDDAHHGTHVAGLAAGAVVGVAPSAKILPVKVMGPLGGGDMASIIAGIYYAADRGADFINMSLSVDTFLLTPEEAQGSSDLFTQAAKYAKSKGSVLVVSAGNGDPLTGEGFDIDQNPVYPASISLTNIVTVSAVDSSGALTTYSNFGSRSVTFAAPGGNQKNPLFAPFYAPQVGAYLGLSGTSMAAPVVAGALAVVKSANKSLKSIDTISILSKTGTPKSALSGLTKTGTEINLAEAVKKATSPGILTRVLSWAGIK